MIDEQDGRTGEAEGDDVSTTPFRAPNDGSAGDPAPRAGEVLLARESGGAGRLRVLGQDVERLDELVARLSTTAAALGERLDGEVRGALGSAERALAEAEDARRSAGEADARMRLAETRAEAALREADEAREELRKGLAAAKASVTAAQDSEANAWRETGAAQQARATAANEVAHFEGLRKRAEAAWSTEHQARTQAEGERGDLATRLAAEQTALATARAELKDGRAELKDARTQVEDARTRLEAAAEIERRLREELATAQAEVARLAAEREAAAARADEQAARADEQAARADEQAARAERAEKLADDAAVRVDEAAARADRAEERADAASTRADAAATRADATGTRADRDAATALALQDTLRSALDLPSVEDLGDGFGVPVDDSGVITAEPGGLVGIQDVPDLLDGELAARFARAVLAVRVHQVIQRPVKEETDEPAGETSAG